MISPFVKVYVYNAIRKKIIKPGDIDTVLLNELRPFNNWSGKIKYAWFWSAGVHVPNASATISGLILINAEWAVKIVIDQNNPIMHDAFAMTVNHEITHQENDFFYLDLFSSDGKFVNWINEVHADFGGIDKAFGGSYNRAICAMKYKLSCKKRLDRDTRSHPSWKLRMDYVLNYDFNDELIEKIAKDCSCTNEKLICAVKKHFTDINLRR